MTTITILYALTAPAVTDTNIIQAARLGEYFPAIGRGEYSWVDYLMSCVGLKGVSSGYWFVLVTFVSYILFLVLKETIGIKRRLTFIIVYAIGLAAFGSVTISLGWPAHYWRNLWALVVGLSLALYEKEFVKKKTLLVAGVVLIDIYLVVYSILFHDAGIFYIIFANAALIMVALCSWSMAKFELRKDFNLILWLFGLSYVVYLIHGSLLHEQWLVFGYQKSLLLIIAVTLIVAMPLNKLSKSIIRKIN